MSKAKLVNDLGESRLLDMENVLDRDLPNKKEAVRAIAQSIRRELALCCETPQPLGRFLIVGPNGETRKLAISLAQFFFCDENSVLRLDMNDYSEKHQVLRLIGHSGGMVCAFFQGTLTDPVWRQPQSVVLLENADRAHSDVWKMLNSILEDGIMIEGMGRSVSFTDSIIILTTTIGFEESMIEPEYAIDADRAPARILNLKIREALERDFYPETLRLVQEIILLH